MNTTGSPLLVAMLAGGAMLNACSAAPVPSPRDVADANDLGQTVKPETAHERQLLLQLSQLPNGTPRRVGDTNVVAETPYSAASGHTCRAVRLTAEAKRTINRRLACTNGRGWFFVPDVFVGALKD